MEKTKEECNIIGTIVSNFDEVKGVNKPQLSAKMQPIKWVANGEGNLIETPTNKDDSDWYDYENQKWANAKTEDGSYWVWIPRYAYKIIEGFHSNTTGNIKIKFLKDTTNTDKEGNKVETEGYEFGIKDTSMHYFQHPAFKFGEDDLEGFWIAKFEPSGVENDINIFPNAESLTWMTVSEQFTAALNMKTNGKYGWSESEVDTHMMKNTEWGAVAYLSKSKYGANDKEIYNNPVNPLKTGCAGNNNNSYFGNDNNCNPYYTEKGWYASTTHTIYGIYDISGGAYEYVAAFVNNGSEVAKSGSAILAADKKYRNEYELGTPNTHAANYEANKNMYGDAIYETSGSSSGSNSWYSDYSRMPEPNGTLFSTGPWFRRGGSNSNLANAGAFFFQEEMGGKYTSHTFRPVVIVGNFSSSIPVE